MFTLTLTICFAFINIELAFIFAILSIIFLALIRLKESLTSIPNCAWFLIMSTGYSLFIGIMIFYFLLIQYNIYINGDIGILVGIIVITLIQLLLFIVVTFKAEYQIARISILIVLTIATMVFTLGSAIINALPLTELNEIILGVKSLSANERIYLKANYDGRVIFNMLIQMLVYPIWCNSMIATVLLEYRNYKNMKRLDRYGNKYEQE